MKYVDRILILAQANILVHGNPIQLKISPIDYCLWCLTSL